MKKTLLTLGLLVGMFGVVSSLSGQCVAAEGEQGLKISDMFARDEDTGPYIKLFGKNANDIDIKKYNSVGHKLYNQVANAANRRLISLKNSRDNNQKLATELGTLCEKLKKTIRTGNDTLERTISERDTANSNLKRMTSQNQKLQGDYVAATTEIKNLKTELSEKSTKIKTLTSDLNDATNKLNDADRNAESLAQQLDESRDSAGKLSSELAKRISENEELTKRLNMAEESQREQETKLANVQREFQNAQEQIRRLNADVAELQEKVDGTLTSVEDDEGFTLESMKSPEQKKSEDEHRDWLKGLLGGEADK